MKLFSHKIEIGETANTLSAASRALNSNYYGVETDVILDRNLFQIFKTEDIAIISQVLYEFTKKQKAILFDLKTIPDVDHSHSIFSLISFLKDIPKLNYYFTSYDHEIIKIISTKYQKLNTALIICSKLINMNDYILKSGINYLHIPYNCIDRQLHGFLIQNNIKIIATKVDSLDDIENCKKMGIEFGVTNVNFGKNNGNAQI